MGSTPGAACRKAGAHLPRQICQVVDVAQDSFCPLGHLPPDRREQDATMAALCKRDAKRLLQLGDLCAEGRLAYVAALRRAMEMQGVGQRGEASEVLEGDHGA